MIKWLNLILQNISNEDARRIQNAANRTNQKIVVVGSQAGGTAHLLSDWDYIMYGDADQRHGARSSVPHGVAGGEYGTGIDIYIGYPETGGTLTKLIESKPHVVFTPQPTGGGGQTRGGGSGRKF